MVLASSGIYGVLSFVTARRTAEFGLRIALGATRADLIRMVLRDGTKPVFIEMTIGVFRSLALALLVRSMLFGVLPADMATMLSVSVMGDHGQ